MAGLPEFFARWRGSAPAPSSPAPTTAPPLPRAPDAPHHWLTLVVARVGPHEPLPVAGARVVVRPFPRGATEPGDACARGVTGSDGTLSLLLPAGRYAVAAVHEGDGRHVTVSLEHAGRALLLLERLGRRAKLTVEVSRPDGAAYAEAAVEVRAVPAGTLAARGATDERGVAELHVPPGAYEVRVGDVAARTFLETDTLLRLTAEVGAAPHAEPAPDNRYANRVRVATSYVAPYDVGHVREDILN